MVLISGDFKGNKCRYSAKEISDGVFSEFLKKLSSALEISGFKHSNLSAQKLYYKKIFCCCFGTYPKRMSTEGIKSWQKCSKWFCICRICSHIKEKDHNPREVRKKRKPGRVCLVLSLQKIISEGKDPDAG